MILQRVEYFDEKSSHYAAFQNRFGQNV